MKKFYFVFVALCLAFAALAVPVEQPTRAWGQPLPSYCLVTFDSDTFKVAVSQRPGVPAPKDARPCTSEWFGNALRFWRWFGSEK